MTAARDDRGHGLAMDAVVEDEEREPEDRERVLGPQLPSLVEEDVELLGEAVDNQGRQLARLWVDVAQVVARVFPVVMGPAAGRAVTGPTAGRAAGEHQA